MRMMRRYLVLAFASVAALAVGGVGVASANHGPGNNTGINCTPTNSVPQGGNCQNNVSSLPTWNVAPSALPGTGNGGTNGGTGTLANVGLTIQTHTNYSHPGDPAQGGKAAKVELWFDNDVAVSLAGVPSCSATFGPGTTIQQAWNTCGPGAGAANNAYLSPPTAVSGTISTGPPPNFPGCNLVFKKRGPAGGDQGQLLLFARATLSGDPNAVPNCSNPANNTAGNTSTTLTGTLSTQAITPDYKTKLTVPVISPLALDDFKSTVKRGGVFKARCRDTNKQLHLRGKFTYEFTNQANAFEQPPDTVTKTKACT